MQVYWKYILIVWFRYRRVYSCRALDSRES